MTRPFLLAIGLIAACIPAASSAQSNPRADRMAYDYAVRCVVVTPLARERGLTNGDGSHAYDMAQALGTRLGQSMYQTASDIRARTQGELAAMLRDRSYLNRTLDECRRLRLL